MDREHESVVEFMTPEEPSRVHRMTVPVPIPTPPAGSERFWKGALLVFSTLGAAIVLAGGLGKLLYVTRAEYVIDTQTEVVARENMRGTLERLDRTLQAQAAAFDRLAGEVQTIKVDVATVGKKR